MAVAAYLDFDGVAPLGLLKSLATGMGEVKGRSGGWWVGTRERQISASATWHAALANAQRRR